jgi:hypothetical protein
MYRLSLVALTLLPLVVWLLPEADRAASLPLLSFYLIGFSSFAAGILSVLLSENLRTITCPHRLRTGRLRVEGILSAGNFQVYLRE